MTIKKFLLFIWQLPQHLVGVIVYIALRPYRVNRFNNKKVYWFKGFYTAFSLGNFIFISYHYEGKNRLEKTLNHEYGHSRQSTILGPFYLLIVALPSIFFNIISIMNKSFADNYFNRFPENWADKLGNVKR